MTERSHQPDPVDQRPRRSPPAPLHDCAATNDAEVSPGVDAAAPARRSRRLVSPVFRRGVWALVGFLVASLVLPAATKQWSDRSDELQLKRDLVSDITRITTDTVTVAQCVVTKCTYDPAGTLQPDGTNALLLEAHSELQRLYRETREEWFTSAEVMDVLLRTYFPESDLPGEWASFSTTVDAFMRIGSGECGTARTADMDLLQTELPAVDADVWRDLMRGIGPDCQTTPEHWPPAYAEVGRALLERRQALTDQVLQGNAVGYSSGWGDFLDDLYPL